LFDSNSEIAIAFHDNNNYSWTTGWVISSGGNVGYEPSIVIDGTDIYIFYEDDQDDIVYDKVKADTYYFDGSDVPAVQDGSGWTDVANSDDGDIATYAANASTTGSPSSNYIKIEGTNAPAADGTIQTVFGREYGSVDAYPAAWGIYTILSIPPGGWTWAKIQALESYTYGASQILSTAIYTDGKVNLLGTCAGVSGDGDFDFEIHKVDVLVLSWEGETLLEEGTYQDVKPRWAFLVDNDSGGPLVTRDTYYFDGSDVLAVQDGVGWSDVTNADDGTIGSDASSSTAGSTVADYIKIEGTNALGSGNDIIMVRARIYGSQNLETDTLAATIYTDGLTDVLGVAVWNNGPVEGWDDYKTLLVPPGGWTWAKVQALETKIYITSLPDGIVYVSKIEVQVFSRSSLVEIDYLFSDGTDVYWNNLDLSPESVEYTKPSSSHQSIKTTYYSGCNYDWSLSTSGEGGNRGYNS
jgi:hypothetical protein